MRAPAAGVKGPAAGRGSAFDGAPLTLPPRVGSRHAAVVGGAERPPHRGAAAVGTGRGCQLQKRSACARPCRCFRHGSRLSPAAAARLRAIQRYVPLHCHSALSFCRARLSSFHHCTGAAARSGAAAGPASAAPPSFVLPHTELFEFSCVPPTLIQSHDYCANGVYGKDQTPLHWAAASRDVLLATLLLDHGASKEAKDTVRHARNVPARTANWSAASAGARALFSCTVPGRRFCNTAPICHTLRALPCLFRCR